VLSDLCERATESTAMVMKCHSIVLALSLPVFAAARLDASPEIRWNPVAASGSVICTPGQGSCRETEIILSNGAVVTLFLEVSGWDPDQDGEPLLGAYQGTIDWVTLLGGLAPGVAHDGHPGNPGTQPWADLITVGASGRLRGAILATHVCTDYPEGPDMSDPVTLLSDCDSWPGCPPSHTMCVERPDYVYYQLENTPVVSTAWDWSWAATSMDCAVDPDGGVSKYYGGTLRLIVPYGATGTYNVGLIDDFDFTLMNSCDGLLIRSMQQTYGQITIIPGATDCDGNGVPDQDELDSDGDDVIDACDGCPDDANKIDPGICGCGISDELDGDGDDVPDCVDQCPGVDDEVFAPDCVDKIPTVSQWGLIVTALLLLAGGKICFGRRLTVA